MAKNISVYIGAIYLVICVLNSANAYNYASLEDIEGNTYSVNWNNSYLCQNATIYVEQNETIYTSKTNISEFSGLQNLSNYSSFKWGKIAFGWSYDDPDPDVYYILVYDGSNDGNAKYDTIIFDTDKNFSDKSENDSYRVGGQFTVSNKILNKSYTI